MPKRASSALQDGGLNYLKANAAKIWLIKNFTTADSDATVAGNKVAEVTTVSGDWTLSSSGTSRVVTGPTGKSGNATASTAGSDDLHIAVVDSSNGVIYVTDETTNQVITSGNPVNFPAIPYTIPQPV
jgi:hypothetical protein